MAISGSIKAHTRYYTKNGDIAVGVTTVLNVLNKPFLVAWANRLGLQGIDSTKFRDKMASIGTIAHLKIMSELSNAVPDLSEFSPADVKTADICLVTFHEWLTTHELKPIILETPLVSDIYGYGGTPDFVGHVNGELELLDFKTGNALYNDYHYQVAAYRQLLHENGHDIKRARLLRVGRNPNEGFEERMIISFDNEFALFLSCLKIYNLLKIMGRTL